MNIINMLKGFGRGKPHKQAEKLLKELHSEHKKPNVDVRSSTIAKLKKIAGCPDTDAKTKKKIGTAIIMVSDHKLGEEEKIFVRTNFF